MTFPIKTFSSSEAIGLCSNGGEWESSQVNLPSFALREKVAISRAWLHISQEWFHPNQTVAAATRSAQGGQPSATPQPHLLEAALHTAWLPTARPGLLLSLSPTRRPAGTGLGATVQAGSLKLWLREASLFLSQSMVNLNLFCWTNSLLFLNFSFSQVVTRERFHLWLSRPS